MAEDKKKQTKKDVEKKSKIKKQENIKNAERIDGKIKNKDNKNIEKSSDNKKNKKGKKKKVWKVILIIFIVLILLFIIAAGIAIGAFFGTFGDELNIEKEDLIISTKNTRVLDSDGELIAVISGDEKMEVITLEQMPEYLPKAYIAIEDERFETHHGIDLKRTVGAIIDYVLGDSSYGGSSITQQLVKNITKDDERHWTRKIKEWVRAYNLENILSKQQILEMYLNILFVGGPEIHGVELGAKYYFNKSAIDLTLAEAAYMAGINSSPNAYNPFVEDEDGSRMKSINWKVKVVLDKMLALEYITQEQYDEAVAEVEEGLAFEKGTITTTVYSYHTEEAIKEVIHEYMAEKNCSYDMAKAYVFGGGLTIYSTQDSDIQKTMEEEYQKEKWTDNSKLTSRETKDEDGEYVSVQSAMVIIDHKTGYVVGTVGGLGERTTVNNLNRATESKRQTGSSMKPLAVIAPALEEGIITAGSVYDDVSTRFGNWTPGNYYSGYKGLSTVRDAITISQNIVPVKILSQLGTNNAIKFLQQLGITSIDEKEDNALPLALGGLTWGVSPLEMAGAYATFANDGVYIEPTFFTKVEDSSGEVVLETKQESRRVMSTANAYILKTILKSVVTSGTATNCKVSGMDVGAKTGTTDEDKDRWLCGFTPYYTGVVWFGYDTPERIRYGYNPGSEVFRDVMREIHEDLDSAKFDVPDNITRVKICKSSGLLATEDCENAINGDCSYTEVYVSGTQPKKTCTTHVKALVCEVSKDVYELANEACPDAKELVFITRKDSDKNDAWKKADDAKYMLPTVTCTRHTKVEESTMSSMISASVQSSSIVSSSSSSSTTQTSNSVQSSSSSSSSKPSSSSSSKPSSSSSSSSSSKPSSSSSSASSSSSSSTASLSSSSVNN